MYLSKVMSTAQKRYSSKVQIPQNCKYCTQVNVLCYCLALLILRVRNLKKAPNIIHDKVVMLWTFSDLKKKNFMK